MYYSLEIRDILVSDPGCDPSMKLLLKTILLYILLNKPELVNINLVTNTRLKCSYSISNHIK